MSQLRLVRPHFQFKDSHIAGLHEFSLDSEKLAWIYLGDAAPLDTPVEDFEKYVRALLSLETISPPGFVCSTVYWAEYQGQVVGRISIRHELNDFLRKAGGHIGYIVRPSFKRRGFATEMLRQVLSTERASSIGKVLVTCDEHNTASEKTILKNGGVFENVADLGPSRPKKKRFWMSCSVDGRKLV